MASPGLRLLAALPLLAALAACASAPPEGAAGRPPPVTGPVAPGGPLAGVEALRRDILRLRAEDAASRAALEAELDRLEAELDGTAAPGG